MCMVAGFQLVDCRDQGWKKCFVEFTHDFIKEFHTIKSSGNSWCIVCFKKYSGEWMPYKRLTYEILVFPQYKHPIVYIVYRVWRVTEFLFGSTPSGLNCYIAAAPMGRLPMETPSGMKQFSDLLPLALVWISCNTVSTEAVALMFSCMVKKKHARWLKL